MFKPQFTEEETIKWKNTLERLYVHTGPDELGMEFFTLMSGPKERTFAANVDRTRTYDDIIVCTTIPEKEASLSFNECAADQAKNIHAIVKEHSLTPYLLWSGGLDSTGALYALLDEGIKFNVIFDQTSYDEYPKVAQQLLNNEMENATPLFITNREITFPNHAEVNKDALYLTGDMGDQTFGTAAKSDYVTKMLPIETCVDRHMISQELYEATAPSIAKLIKNPTLSEFLWGLSFIFKYQDAQLRIGAMGLSCYGPKQNTIHFFDTDNFQLYNLNNYKENCSFINPVNYKLPLKQYIYEHDGDEEYFKNKTKEGSYLIGAYAVKY